MDLEKLRELGGFVPPTPVSREVSWTHPGAEGQDVTDTFTVRVKKLSAGTIERLWSEAGKKPDRSYTAMMIAETICLGDEGDTRLSYDEAFQLEPSLAEALLEDAVHQVNPLNRRKAAKKLTAAGEFWHELVLNGVGGRTVEEAKERLTYAEALDWREYLERRGTVHLGMRMEAGFALIALSINRALGGKAKIEDFMPHLDPKEASLEDVMKLLVGSK